MMNLQGYQIVKKLAEGSDRVVYSAIRESDQLPVVLKAPRSGHPSADLIALMCHEYAVGKDLNFPGIIQTYALIEEQNQYVLVQEDMGGISLSQYLQKNSIKELACFLKLAIQMVRILGELHHNHIIHKDIKPGNFIIHPETLLIKLTDLNFSSKLLHEAQGIAAPSRLEGTLSYMAPEQTGRMNMNIDYRADFYALGVSFYEMLNGEVPFLFSDPLELLHAHLASPVPKCSNQAMDISPVLERIIMKLMAKNPTDRYQSTSGLLADLERCQKELEAVGKIEDFPLGEHDVFDRLNLSQKLYGRFDEVNTLLEAYERASDGAVEALMVCGYSGIGKTMLINEVHKPMVQHKGYFISGKFDQLQRNTPYTAITQAFNQLARLIIAEPEARFEAIKKELSSALGSVAQVMINLAPDIELIIGPQPPLEQIGAQESQNRMMYIYKRFLHVIATKEHPLVIFIDDLQWIDSGSLKLLEYILTDDELSHVLLIGAYRDNEVDDHHPLRQLFKQMEAQGKKIPSLVLKPLTTADFEALFKDSFNRDEAAVKPLAALIHKRTEGNPFFCKQVINTLYKEHLLFFDYEHRQWNWNLEGITALKITDNVVDLMLAKLSKLPQETQDLLHFAACLGNRFQVAMLVVISGKTADEIGKALWPALQEELIVSLRSGHKHMDAMQHEHLAALLSKEITYQFIHDRVQQAVYQGISVAEKQETHLSIARLLLEKKPEACKKERLFELADHFDQALALLHGEEKLNVIHLNYQAAMKARHATAYQPMSNYLISALSLLDEGAWTSNYDLSFAVNSEYAWSLFLLNQVEETNALLSTLLPRARTNLDKVSVHRLHIKIYHSTTQLKKLFETLSIALGLLGIKFVANPKKRHVLMKLAQVQWKLRQFHIEQLENELPTVTDSSIIAAFEILQEAAFSAAWRGPKMYSYLTLVAMDLQLRYGKPKNAAFWFFCFALLLRFADSKVKCNRVAKVVGPENRSQGVCG